MRPSNHVSDNTAPGAKLSAPTVRNVALELEELFANGFESTFSVRPNAVLCCGSCGAEEKASEVEILDVRRLEGQSDPADMSAVVAAKCGRCQKLGSVVLTFGPQASEADAEVLAALDEHKWREHKEGSSTH
jgi:hypothetical protein